MPVRKDGRGTWRYRVQVRLPDGGRTRISGTPAINTKMHAEIAERAHIERVLRAPDQAGREIPTFDTFATKFLATYVSTNNKRSEQDAKRWILDRHLRPVFGAKRLDQIGRLEIDAFKAKLGRDRAPKTMNNI